jgi:hypothetical protein
MLMFDVRSSNMTVQGTCRLCERDGELQESHIIPKFVFAHQKETSATGFLRCSEVINRRAQDGPKLPTPCGVTIGSTAATAFVTATKASMITLLPGSRGHGKTGLFKTTIEGPA